MSQIALADPPRISAFEVASTTMSLLFGSQKLFWIACIGAALSTLVQEIARALGEIGGKLENATPEAEALGEESAVLLVAVVFVGLLIFVPILTLTRVGFDHLLGDDIGPLEAFQESIGRYFPLLGLFIVSTLAVTAGTLLLVIPGLVLAAFWLVAGPACICDELGPLDSLGRSYELTRGNRTRLFLTYAGLYALVAIIVAVVVAVVDRLLGHPAAVLIGIPLGAVTFAVYVLFPLVAYVRLASAQAMQDA